jgi:putative Mn2+ efflux pump MntP
VGAKYQGAEVRIEYLPLKKVFRTQRTANGVLPYLNTLDIVFIALGLAMDAFAVSIGAGSSNPIMGKRGAFRISFHFGLFQFLMPIIGWFLGMAIEEIISPIDHWIAFFLLSFVGGRMIKSGLYHGSGSFPSDPSRGLILVALSLATSIDALAVGVSFAMLRVKIWYPSILIGIITASLCLFGVSLGEHLGKNFGKRMEILGGSILIGTGIRILLSHMII